MDAVQGFEVDVDAEDREQMIPAVTIAVGELPPGTLAVISADRVPPEALHSAIPDAVRSDVRLFIRRHSSLNIQATLQTWLRNLERAGRCVVERPHLERSWDWAGVWNIMKIIHKTRGSFAAGGSKDSPFLERTAAEVAPQLGVAQEPTRIFIAGIWERWNGTQAERARKARESVKRERGEKEVARAALEAAKSEQRNNEEARLIRAELEAERHRSEIAKLESAHERMKLECAQERMKLESAQEKMKLESAQEKMKLESAQEKMKLESAQEQMKLQLFYSEEVWKLRLSQAEARILVPLHVSGASVVVPQAPGAPAQSAPAQSAPAQSAPAPVKYPLRK